MRSGALLVVLASSISGCSGGNELPSTGMCDVPGAATIPTPSADPVALAGHPASFDDVRYSAALGRVIAAPRGTGTVYLVDPDTLEVTSLSGLPSGIASMDEGLGWIFVADRGGHAILVIDPTDGSVVASHDLGVGLDYVRFCEATGEVWVTEPGSDRIAILSVDAQGQLGDEAEVSVPDGPEGLAFDTGRRRAFAHASGSLVAIDVDERRVVDRWDTGCAGSHGIPAVDPARGLVLAGCSSAGGGVIVDVDRGEAVSGVELGSGEALLAVAPQLGHFYLRGDPGGEAAILGVCDDGSSSELGKVAIDRDGHGLVADDRGNLWVCDADTGGLLRIRDPYPAAP